IEVIDCSKGVSLLDSSGEYHDADGHGELKDPHIWMSPPNAVKMVQNIYEGLVLVDPENRGYYESNRDAYINRLTVLDKGIKERLSGVTNRRFIAYHSAFEYFAREYGLTTLTVEVDGKEPTAAGVTRLIKEAKDYNIRVIFTSAEFNPQSAKVIAGALEGRVVMVDTLPANYIDSMYIFLDELIKSWEQA
ncbi:MAG: zinc ABC transporter substrate-binding protein, partial [Dehalococcoidia bacterium]|nr:zinc ABC transporter substrate-binding protein [Dehalococcoidia bacterium]